MELFGKTIGKQKKKSLEPVLPKVQDDTNGNTKGDDIPWDYSNKGGFNMPVNKPANPFSYVKGTGKGNKAEYRIGKGTVPAAVISRIIKDVVLEATSERKKEHIIFARLHKNYSDFLDALDSSGLEYYEAFKMMLELKPVKETTRTRIPKTAKTAEALAKGICKRFKGTPQEMVKDFVALVITPDFQNEAVEIISTFQRDYGVGPTGFTKTSARKGNPNAIKALAKARAAKK